MEKPRPGRVDQKATDIEAAAFLIGHITNPCEDEQGNNIRSIYIREAQRLLPNIKDPDAKKLLEDIIKEHTEPSK